MKFMSPSWISPKARPRLKWAAVGAAVLVFCRFGVFPACPPPAFAQMEYSSPAPGSRTVMPVHTAVPIDGVRIVNTYPHDSGAFTQGLVYSGGYLYESTGLKGKSRLRKVELETGRIVRELNLPENVFGEGLTEWKGRLIQLTWRSRLGFVFDMKTFEKEKEFTYTTEGWGITRDETSLIMSDGSSTLRFLDPDTFSEIRTVRVRKADIFIHRLNELEYVKGEILANVWGLDHIVRINPDTGDVMGWIDAGQLRERLKSVRKPEVLNGIAYDAEKDRLFVTGKYWPNIFEIRIVPKN